MRRMSLILSSASGPAILSGSYANTLTRLFPDIYAALDVISRELVGFLPGLQRNASAERAAVGQTVVYPIMPAVQAFDIVPAMVTPEPPDLVVGNATMTITKAKAVPVGFTGEEQRGLNTGPGYLSVQADWIAQGLRTLVNQMEVDVATEATLNASRAYGTAGTTPFASDNLSDVAQMKKILDDNGAPASGRSLILNTSAGANLRTVKNLTRVNEAGATLTLRQGELLDVFGFSIKESAAVVQFTAGTAAGATTNAAGYAVGATVITIASAGTGVVKSGEVITFAGDTNKYVVASGDSDTSNGGTITLAAPGLRVAIPAAATAITVVASHAANIAFSQNALAIAMRPPAIPVEGDDRIDSMLITDPRSGITFEFSIWPGYRKVRMEIALAWGYKAVKPEHIAMLLG